MKAVLIPIDFSKASDAALLFGLHLAKKEKATPFILHVVSPYAGLDNNIYQIFDYSEYLEERRLATEDYLFKFKQKNNLGKLSTQVICESGNVTELILNYSIEKQCGLIIMGALGSSNISKILLGSNTQSVLGLSKIPLMIIPLGYSFEDYNKKVCFATDFHFKLNHRSLELLEQFNFLKTAWIQFVHISDEKIPVYKEKHSELIALLFGKLKTKIKYIFSDNLSSSLETYMQASESSLLILLPHNHNFLYNLFFRGHTVSLIRKLKYPILVLYEHQ
ncbi:MAG TPA: universal stress protein [Saprospiraceae bacterium]|nr:universal stress protein [Saprospiraceae bacterium]